MGVDIACYVCGNIFPIHGYEELKKCYNCKTWFNPQTQGVPPEEFEENRNYDMGPE